MKFPFGGHVRFGECIFSDYFINVVGVVLLNPKSPSRFFLCHGLVGGCGPAFCTFQNGCGAILSDWGASLAHSLLVINHINGLLVLWG